MDSRLQNDSVIGHYRIDRLVGSGGIGEVYLAEDLDSGRKVAIKLLHQEQCKDWLATNRFLREAKHAAELGSHPCICPVIETVSNKEWSYYVMEYIPGRTLKEIQSTGLLPLDRVLRYALDIADALALAHEHRIIHRDLKPSNVIISQVDRAVVLDFGLSKQLEDAYIPQDSTLSHLVKSHWIWGTISYLSPEQVTHQPIDVRADQFSFGILLYEMLTGKNPFLHISNVDTLHTIINVDPDPPTRVRPSLNPKWDKVVMRALRKKPGDRYPNIRELRNDLSTLTDIRLSDPKLLKAVNTSRYALSDFYIFLKRWSFVFAIAFITLIVVVGAREWASLRKQDAAIAAPRVKSLMNWKMSAGYELTNGRFSPTGNCIAYNLDGSSDVSIWIKCGDADAMRLLDSGVKSWSPVWSPDGNSLAYFSKAGDQMGVWTTSTAGDNLSLLFELPAGVVLLPSLVAWQGNAIYYEVESNLWRFDLDSHQSSKLTIFQAAHGYPRSFSLAPDGKKIAFVDNKSGIAHVYVSTVNGQNPVQVTDGPENEAQPVWSANGQEIIYSSRRYNRYQVFVTTLGGGNPQQLTSGDSDSHATDISADGKILAFSSLSEADIWSYNMGSDGLSEIAADKELELDPQLSPDGHTLAYQQDNSYVRMTTGRIVTKATDGDGTPREITNDGFYPVWSPDGKRLAFLRLMNNSKVTLWISGNGEAPKQIGTDGLYFGAVSTVPFSYYQAPAFNWLHSNNGFIYQVIEKNRPHLIISTFDGQREEIPVDVEDGMVLGSFLPSPDSTKIAFVSSPLLQPAREHWGIWLLDLTTNTTQMILDSDNPLALNQWLSDSNRLIVSQSQNVSLRGTDTSDIELSQLNIHTAKKTILAVLPSAYLAQIRLIPKSNHVSYISRQDGRDNLWMFLPESNEHKRLTTNFDPREYYSGLRWRSDGKIAYWTKQNSRAEFVQIEEPH